MHWLDTRPSSPRFTCLAAIIDINVQMLDYRRLSEWTFGGNLAFDYRSVEQRRVMTDSDLQGGFSGSTVLGRAPCGRKTSWPAESSFASVND